MNRREFAQNTLQFGTAIIATLLTASCGRDEDQQNTRTVSDSSEGSTRKTTGDLTRENKTSNPQTKPGHSKKKRTNPTPDPRDQFAGREEEEGETYVDFYPLYAMATYFDGTTGPVTGEISAAMMNQISQEETLVFWHGHGGQSHQFTLNAEQKLNILRNKRVEITTSTIASHEHLLFIDPTTDSYRIPGAAMVRIKLPEETSE